MEFGVLCCLTTPGLRKDIRRQIRRLYSHKKLHIMYIIISYYFHIYYHILAFISITNENYPESLWGKTAKQGFEDYHMTYNLGERLWGRGK